MTVTGLERWYRQGLVAAFLLVATVPAARAAETCEDAATLGDCFAAIRATVVPDDAEEIVEAAAAEEKAEVEEKPTGLDTGGTTLQSTTKGFLPLLVLSGLFGRGDVGENPGDVVFDLNFLLPGGLAGKNSQLQAVAKTQPVLPALVNDALPEDARDELAGKLEEQISAGDDLLVSFTYNLQGRNRGRNFELYRGRYAALVQPKVAALIAAQSSVDVMDRILDELEACADLDLPDDPMKLEFSAIEDACGEQQARRTRADIVEDTQAFFSPLAKLRAELVATGLDRFAELVANQPQLHLSLRRNERSALAGANVTAGNLTYEYARVNLARALPGDCSQLEDAGPQPDAALLDRCAKHYQRYVTSNAAQIATGERFSLSLEYESVEAFVVPLSTLLPDVEGLTDLRVPGSEKRIAALGWSRNYAGPQGVPTRMDLVARYEDVAGDPTRNDRLVATATVNLQVLGLDVPVGIVYANRGEYLGEVDNQLSAHLGIKIDLKNLGLGPAD